VYLVSRNQTVPNLSEIEQSAALLACDLNVTATVTETLVLRPLLEDRGRITVNPYPGARKQNQTELFSESAKRNESVAHSIAVSYVSYLDVVRHL